MTDEGAPRQKSQLASEYDSDSDTLYISKLRAQPSVAKNNGTGIVVRYSMASPRQPYAVNIEKFKATASAGDLAELSSVIARLLFTDRESVLAALQRHR
jgi:hypothetical protein